MRIQPRNRVGKYKHSSWHNFKKRKRGWREYAIHPITVSVFGLISYVGVHTAWAFDEAGKLESKFTIYNFSQENAREDSKGDGLSPSTNPEESTGETVQAVSDSEPRESEDGGVPINPAVPASSVEAKILKAWEGTGDEAKMVDIIKCESRFNPETIGDMGIQFEQDGKLWGRSVGLAQVRILPGRTDNPEEYEKKLKDVDFNLKEGRGIYDRQGLLAWKNCAKKVGAL